MTARAIIDPTSPLLALVVTEEEARRVTPDYAKIMKTRRCMKLKIETMREIARTNNYLRRLRLRMEVIDLEIKAAGL